MQVTDCQGSRIWASHVLAAYDYAAANGATIVLAPQGFPAAAAAEAPAAAAATSSSSGGGAGSGGGCGVGEAVDECETARKEVFRDAVAGLGAAGVMLVTADV